MGAVIGVGRSGMGVVMVLVDQAWVCRLLVMVQVWVRRWVLVDQAWVWWWCW